ncbi:MAG: CAP domain-containing protein [Candidatus Paceibacterota bacterium]|jgi:uncharacterized protein YkwD
MIKKTFFGIVLLLTVVGSVYFGMNYYGIKKIDFNFPIEDTKNIISEIEKEINSPPPLKYSNGYNTRTNLTISGVLKWTNDMRNANGGLTALKENAKLDAIAQLRLDDMFKEQYFEHISPSGIGVSDVAKEYGYEYITIGENIALGNFDGDKALVDAWMNSPGHRANILNGRYAEIGIAVQKGQYEKNETWMAIQVFALPLSACPKIDTALKQKIDQNNTTITSAEASINGLKDIIDSSNPRSEGDIAVYNKNVRRYNQMVSDINALIKETKNYVTTYNAEVDAFNSCAKAN